MAITDAQAEVYRLHKEEGLSLREIARRQGKGGTSVRELYARAKKWHAMQETVDPAVLAGMAEIGLQTAPGIAWVKTHGPDKPPTYSFLVKTAGEEAQDFKSFIVDSLEDYAPLDQTLYAPRVNHGARGDKLMVLDLADIHFGKLSVKEETGFTYHVEVARHRVIEGTRALLARAEGVSRILFVMGNDILHTDNGKTTTSGTPQDTDGSYFTAWRAAQHASIDAIKECAPFAGVDLLHCMSNHDWRTGWALSQTIAASVKGLGNVRATDYNLSERHRKYYGYEASGMVFTHGDGCKDKDLTALFMREAKPMVAECHLFYAYLHHFHHKMRTRRGIDVFMSEKDHTAYTQINTGAARVEGVDMMAEHVRSATPPDGWHDRQGYVNRQAVEAFLHCPHDGQKDRLTEWF